MYKRKIEPEKKTEAVEAYQCGKINVRENMKRFEVGKVLSQRSKN